MKKFMIKSDRVKGVIFIILSALGLAFMSAFVKLSGDLPNFQKVFFRNLVSCIIAFYLIYKHKGRFIGKKENRKILLLRSITGLLGVIFSFYAIDNLVLSDANMLNKLSPFFVIILSALILKEKLNFKQGISLIIAFIGAIFIIKPTFSVNLWYYAVAILGAFFAGASYTCIRFLKGKEAYYTTVFFFSAFSLIVTVIPFVWGYKPMSLMQLIDLLLTGVFASLGQFGLTLAYNYAPAKEISIFDYSNIIFSAALSIAFFGEFPDIISIIGYIVVFSASYYIFLYNKRLDKNREIKK